MRLSSVRSSLQLWILAAAFITTIVVYWPGLQGGFLFDDYPNIVDNHGVQPAHASVSSLVGAALSSPSSEFKRPLASLSFAANYLATGLNPYWMKLTNLVIHLLNGLLVFLLTRALLQGLPVGARLRAMGLATSNEEYRPPGGSCTGTAEQGAERRIGVIAALVAAGWMLLPINLTAVLYVVQRMESMANLFVLLGLLGYVAGRRSMLERTAFPMEAPASSNTGAPNSARSSSDTRGLILCIASITLPTVAGILAKETAVMLPLYAFLIEWILFGFQRPVTAGAVDVAGKPARRSRDRRILALFLLLLLIPMVIGLAWLVPDLLRPERWATRDFTLRTRLFSEARIIVDYIVWTLLPAPHDLSFYHDDFHISTGLLAPWTTLTSILFLVGLAALALWLKPRRPLVTLGIALFLGCQLLTGTILPLELIYEHRNYFASFGLLLAIVPLLAAAPVRLVGAHPVRTRGLRSVARDALMPVAAGASRTGCAPTKAAVTGLPMALPRYVLLAGLLLCWGALTALTAYAWGNPLRLAEDLASRAPESPRAEYELGRTYIIYSHYDPASPFTKLAYAPLERAAGLPDASIMPEQALIFMNSRMHLPLKDAWWDSMIAKLKKHKPGVQDESALGALTQCDHEHRCNLPQQRMVQAYLAALSHPDPSARLLAMYGDYAWNVLQDHDLGMRMTDAAVKTAPSEPAYRITQIRMLVAAGQAGAASKAIKQLQVLNFGGRLDVSIHDLQQRLDSMKYGAAAQPAATQPTAMQ